jgi:hypothetical protein
MYGKILKLSYPCKGFLMRACKLCVMHGTLSYLRWGMTMFHVPRPPIPIMFLFRRRFLTISIQLLGKVSKER